jgi:hypothetical protein
MKIKVLTLAVISLLTATTVNAETEATVSNPVAATDSINGDDFNVTFKKLGERSWQAVLTNSTKPFNIVVDDSEWLREIYKFEGYAERNDSLFVLLEGGYEFSTSNAEWKTVLKGQTIVLTEIKSLQARSTKSYYSLTALEDDQVPFYAAHKPSAKPAKNRRANASVPAPTTPDKKAAKGKKGGKKSKKTEDELIEEILSGNASGFSVEVEGDPKL